MHRLTSSRPSPAMIVALVALGVALGGTSYAAVTLPKNSVSSRQLKNNSITSPKVKDRSLKAQDFAQGELPAGAKGADGAPGPKGDRGPPGERGATGTVDTSNFFTKSESDGRFLATGGTAANASQLGGIGANGFVRGNRFWLTYVVDAGNTSDVGVSNQGGVRINCSDPASTSVRWVAGPGGAVWTDNGTGSTTFGTLGAGGLGTSVAVPNAGHVTWLAGSGSDLDLVEAFVISGPGGANSCQVTFQVDRNRAG